MSEQAASSASQLFAELPVGGLGEELLSRLRELDLLQAELLPLVHRFAKSEEWALSGARGPIEWLAYQGRLARPAAAELVGMGRRLEELPLTSAALLAGEIGFRHAALLFQLAERAGFTAVLGMEAELLEQARTMSPSLFGRLLQRVRGMLDPDGFLEDARHAHENRYLAFDSSLEGVFYMKGKFGAEEGAVIEAALLALMPKRNPLDDRSAGNRRADALIDICRLALDSGQLPEVAGERPHVTLTVSAESLAGVPGSLPPTLGQDLPVPIETAQRLLCDAQLTVLGLDRKGNPLKMGRTRRNVSNRQRRALNARDRGCRFEGCDRPWWWTDAHHLRPWELGGVTDLENLCLLCRHHHQLVHEGGWTIGWREEHDGFFVTPPQRVLCRSG